MKQDTERREKGNQRTNRRREMGRLRIERKCSKNRERGDKG